jgi:hypothetical protein
MATTHTPRTSIERRSLESSDFQDLCVLDMERVCAREAKASMARSGHTMAQESDYRSNTGSRLWALGSRL